MPTQLTVNLIDNHTYNNWIKIRDALAAAGKINSPFYLRAVSVIKTGRDPGPNLPPLAGWSDSSDTSDQKSELQDPSQKDDLPS